MSSQKTDHRDVDEHPAARGPAFVIGVALILCSFWMFVWRASLEGVFHFDDISNIVENDQVRSLWPLTPFFGAGRPVGFYSFALNYHFSGLEPRPYHVVNVFIHLCNGLLLFTGCLLTWKLYRTRWVGDRQPSIDLGIVATSGLIATGWVIHPITTSAVTNVVQRFESLASLGYLGVWLSLLVYLLGYRRIGCAAILVFAWLGLMSKEIFATAPLVMLLLDRLITRDSWRSIAARRWVPYGLLLSPFVWFVPKVMFFFDPVQTADSSVGMGLKTVSSWQYLRTQPEVIWHYLSLTVWPRQLCFDYVWRIQDNPWIYLPLGASMLGLLIAGCGLYYRGGVTSGRFWAGIVGWMILTFFLILAPTSTIMPIADLAFEHRMYLPSAIVIALIVLMARTIFLRGLASSQRPIVLQAGVACIVIATVSMLAWRTHLRNLDYRDGLVLWRTAVEASPKNPRAWYNVGRELIERGDLDAALQPMVKAVGYSNSSVPLYDAGLAHCLQHVGRMEDAIGLFKRALSKEPDYPEVQNSLGAIYVELGRPEEARALFRAAAKQGSPEAIYNLGWMDFKQNNFEAAAGYFRQSLAMEPEFGPAARRLAWIHATSEDPALRDIAFARRLLDEHYDLTTTQVAAAWDTDGVIRAARGDFSGAIESAERALAISVQATKPDPNYISALQSRLASYRRSESWIGGIQP